MMRPYEMMILQKEKELQELYEVKRKIEARQDERKRGIATASSSKTRKINEVKAFRKMLGFG